MNKLVRFCLENKLIVFLLLLFVIGAGIYVMPFDYNVGDFPRDPVPVDAIPDIGENQQIIFTEWMGRSPKDVDDQITYPLTIALLGVPGVKTVRGYSYFGFSSIYVVFKDEIDFYWSRSRILERLSTVQKDLPAGVVPALGPDATALGQIFWYTLEGEGFSLRELRSAQDWNVKYAMQSVDGVSECASVGGYVNEYQIDVDPNAMRIYNVSLKEIFKSIKSANIDVGARTIEYNGVEYVVRGLGFIKSLKDLEYAVIKEKDNTPIYIKNVANVTLGPALRRGALDKGGAEVVGGVVIVRFGENPLEVIKRVKDKIALIAPSLPQKKLSNGDVSQVKIVPFYDRTKLIKETLGTLNKALVEEILITIIVVLVVILHIRSSLLISAMLPIAVLMAFIAMKIFGVDSNIMSLSGIAIAIGTIVDMGIIMCENIIKHLDENPGKNKLEVIYNAASEVAGAITTAVGTTIFSFLPVFAMQGTEGKLFKPLAFTKTFALIASVVLAITIVPPLAHILFGASMGKNLKRVLYAGIGILGIFIISPIGWFAGLALIILSVYLLLEKWVTTKIWGKLTYFPIFLIIFLILFFLAEDWMPLGYNMGLTRNFLLTSFVVLIFLGFIYLFNKFYSRLLTFFLSHKIIFFIIPISTVIFGMTVWLGFDNIFGIFPKAYSKLGGDTKTIRSTQFWVGAKHRFPGMGKEFMPSLDEGSFLYMPTTMPHASIEECLDILQIQDRALSNIPEIETVVGKIGRVDSPLDPAPISMIETVITYKPEYAEPDPVTGTRQRIWRDKIKTSDDIWKEIKRVTKITGATTAPKLQPIAARIVMLQSGMRAPLGMKIKGDDLDEIEAVGIQMEKILKQVPGVEPDAVNADRIVGKPYIEINWDREKIARYGISIAEAQKVLEVAVGGQKITTSIEGRERYPIRARYMREFRDNIENLTSIYVPSMNGVQIPISQLAEIKYVRGPQVIKSEDTFLVGYVLFDKKDKYSEVDVVNNCQRFIKSKLASGELKLPKGISYEFAGSYKNHIHATKRLKILLPITFFIIFFILYFQFRRLSITLFVFSGIAVAWSGGFILFWLYSQDFFMNIGFLKSMGIDLRSIFNIRTFNLSVAVWVGFIALFGVASDDGVVMATYLQQSFDKRKPKTRDEIRSAVLAAGLRRIRPCLMTTATTILALLPVLSSTGRGSDVMVPMAIPVFGGMIIVFLTLFVVPVSYCLLEEIKIKFWDDK